MNCKLLHAAIRTAILSTVLLFSTFISNKALATAFNIQMSIKDSTTTWDNFIMIFDSTGADTYDAMKDGAKFPNAELNFYTYSLDSTQMSIDNRPFANGKHIKAGLTTVYKKSYFLQITTVNVPSGITVFLYDKYTNTTTPLALNTHYNFSVTSDSATQGDNRFEFVFSGYPTTLCKAATAANTRLGVALDNPVIKNTTCYGGNDGAITTSIKCGTPPYSYKWSNNATTANLCNLAAGNYSVTVTDSNGTQATATYTVNNAPKIEGTIAVSPMTPVSGQQPFTIYRYYGPQVVMLSASATGGTPSANGYRYEWTPKLTTLTSYSASTIAIPITTTTYTVTITDSLGCKQSASQTINVMDVTCGRFDPRNPLNIKISVCHVDDKGRRTTKCVNLDQVDEHLAHGDMLGDCNSGNKGIATANDLENADFSIYPNPTTGSFVIDLPADIAPGEIFITDITGKLMTRRAFEAGGKLNFDLQNAPKGVYLIQLNNGIDTYHSKITIN